MQVRSRSLPVLLRAGVLAGFAGGAIVDAYLIATVVFATHAATLEGFCQFVAAGAIGKGAFAGGTGTALLGVAIHFCVSIGWAVGYAYVAATAPQLRSRPIVSGIVFGIFVMLAMQIVEVAAGIYTIPGPGAWFNTLAAHTLFFGIPVAVVTSRTLRT